MTQVIDELTERLVDFINAEVSVSAEPIEADTDLLMTGAVDSLGVMRVTQWMEDELGFEVDPVEVTLENFQTVNKMMAYASTKLPSS